MVEYGHALLRRTNGKRVARELLEDLRPDRLSRRYLDLHRNVNGVHVPAGQLWRVVVRGSPRPGLRGPAAGFFRHYLVAATDPDDAIRLIRDIEPERIWAEVDVDDLQGCGPPKSIVTGVVEASGPVWFGLVSAE